MSNNEERKVEIVEGTGKKGEGADQAIEMQRIEDIRKEEKEMQEHASGTFPLSVLDLEELMGNYKERGNDFRDLQTIENMEVLIIINPKSIKKGSSLSKGQGSLRQKKADVSITVN